MHPSPSNTGGVILNGWPFLKMTSRNRAHGSRTAKECEIKWLGDRHPSINHAQWSQPEISKCRDLVDAYRAEHGHEVTIDWSWVAKELKVMSGRFFKLKTWVYSHPFRPAEHLWIACDTGQFAKPMFGHQNLITRCWKL